MNSPVSKGYFASGDVKMTKPWQRKLISLWSRHATNDVNPATLGNLGGRTSLSAHSITAQSRARRTTRRPSKKSTYVKLSNVSFVMPQANNCSSVRPCGDS